jgi:HEAT repeat protein
VVSIQKPFLTLTAVLILFAGQVSPVCGQEEQDDEVIRLIKRLDLEEMGLILQDKPKETLIKMGAKAFGPLADALINSNSSKIRTLSASILGRIDDPRTIEPLIAALGDYDEKVRRAAVIALSGKGENAYQPLLTAMQNRMFTVRESAALALGDLRDRRALRLLLGALWDKAPPVRAAAAYELGRLRDWAAIRPLIPLLKDADSDVRLNTVNALARLDISQVVSPIAESVNDDDPRVRKAAVDALGLSSNPIIIKPLLSALQDSDPQVRFSAAKSLQKIGDTNAAGTLVEIFRKEEYQSIRSEMCVVILNCRRASVVPLLNLIEDDEVGDRVKADAVLLLGRLKDHRAIEPLLSYFWDKDINVRLRVVEALGEIGSPKSVEHLLEALGDDFILIRYYAARALGKIGDERALKLLLDDLRNFEETPNYYGMTIQSCAKAGLKLMGKPAVEPLILLLEDDDWRTRKAAAVVLGEIGDARAVAPLATASKDKESNVIGSAVSALFMIDDPLAKEKVLEFLRDDSNPARNRRTVLSYLHGKEDIELETVIFLMGDSDWEVRDDALHVFQDIIADTAKKIIKTLDELGVRGYGRAVNALGHIDVNWIIPHLISTLRGIDYKFLRYVSYPLVIKVTPLAGQLIAALQDKDARMRAGAARALCEIGNPLALEALKNALTDEDAAVRRLAVPALGETKDERAIEPIVALLKDENPQVRTAAAEALVRINTADSIACLSPLVNDPDDLVRRRIAKVLGNTRNTAAVEPLISFLSDKEKYVRLFAAEALGAIKDPRAVQPLTEAILKEGREIQWAYFQALWDIGEASVPYLVRLLDSDDSNTRQNSAFVLGELRDARAVEPLIPLLKDETAMVRYRVAEALAKIKDRRAVVPLLYAMWAGDWELESAAAHALREIGFENIGMACSLLNYRDIEPEVAIAFVLRGEKCPELIEPMVYIVEQDTLDLGPRAVEILAEIDDPSVIYHLIVIAEESYETEIKSAANAAIERVKDKDVYALAAALQHPNGAVRYRAQEIIKAAGDVDMGPIIYLLSAEDPDVQTRATDILMNKKDPRALRPLIANLMSENDEVRFDASMVLAELGEPAVEPLIGLLKDKNPITRIYAVNTLGLIKDRRAVRPLVRLLKDKDNDIRQEAVDALREIGLGDLAFLRWFWLF